mgnify:CR=1 FL=1
MFRRNTILQTVLLFIILIAIIILAYSCSLEKEEPIVEEEVTLVEEPVSFLNVAINEDESSLYVVISGFETGKAEVPGEAVEAIDRVYTRLSESNEDVDITIVGHADASGTAERNMQLSEERAQNVADILIAEGLPEDSITIEGKGAEEPRAPNDTAENRRMNRRVEIIVE